MGEVPPQDDAERSAKRNDTPRTHGAIREDVCCMRCLCATLERKERDGEGIDTWIHHDTSFFPGLQGKVSKPSVSLLAYFVEVPARVTGPCGRSLAELLVKVFGEGSTHPMMLRLGYAGIRWMKGHTSRYTMGPFNCFTSQILKDSAL